MPTRVNSTATPDALVTITSQNRRRSTAPEEVAPGSTASAPRRWVVRVEDVDVHFEVAGLPLPHDHVLADVATARPGADLDRDPQDNLLETLDYQEPPPCRGGQSSIAQPCGKRGEVFDVESVRRAVKSVRRQKILPRDHAVARFC